MSGGAGVAVLLQNFIAVTLYRNREMTFIRRMTGAEIVAFERRHGREPRPDEIEIDDHCALPVDSA